MLAFSNLLKVFQLEEKGRTSPDYDHPGPTSSILIIEVLKMYCLQWLIPVLLIPKPIIHPSMLYQHAMFMIFYLIGFFLERKPCYICSAIFLAAVALLCYSDRDSCIFWPTCKTTDNGEQCSYATTAQDSNYISDGNQ